jgi:hypothetical protein
MLCNKHYFDSKKEKYYKNRKINYANNIHKFREIARLYRNSPAGRAERRAWHREYRRKALTIVGRGILKCVLCDCNKVEVLEIHHKNGDGAIEYGKGSTSFYSSIIKGVRDISDLEVRCRLHNLLHFMELKYGELPFKITWTKQRIEEVDSQVLESQKEYKILCTS